MGEAWISRSSKTFSSAAAASSCLSELSAFQHVSPADGFLVDGVPTCETLCGSYDSQSPAVSSVFDRVYPNWCCMAGSGQLVGGELGFAASIHACEEFKEWP